MLRLENTAAAKNERLRVLRMILLQPVTYYKIGSNKSLQQRKFTGITFVSTKEYVLNSYWL